jgi:membrane protein
VPEGSETATGIATEVATDIENAGAAVAAAATGPEQPAAQSKWYVWRKSGTALIAYLLDSEVHTFAFSVAANAIISFIPFVVLLYTLAVRVFHSSLKGPMVLAVNGMVNYFLPSAAKDPKWMTTTIVSEAVDPLVKHQGAVAISVIMILIACTGIFLPLEVALNQAWGVKKSRNYLFNQTIALGLATLMVILGVCSMVANASVDKVLSLTLVHDGDNWFYNTLSFSCDALSRLWLAVSTGAASIIFFFAVYYILPNHKVPWRPVLRTSIVTGIIWLIARFIFAETIPHIDLSIYGPFYISVSLLFWAYISGLILFAGAQFSVARLGNGKK